MMNSLNVSCLLLKLLFLNSCISNTSCKNNICFYANSNGIESFCCDNYELKNGKCIECKDGYTTSGNSDPCEPCYGGTYGRKCSYSCNCLKNQICDNIKGCILENKAEQASTELRDTSFHKNEISTENGATSPEFTDRFDESGLDYDFTTGLCIGLGGLFIMFAIISFLLYRKSKQTSFHRSSHERNSVSIDNENAEDIYDVIDENTLYDDNIIVVYSDGSISSSCHQCEDNDNYLTPCSVDVGTHYGNKKTETDSKESDSLSSINDVSNSGYLHPYQSLLSSTMETSNSYMSMYLDSMLECSKSTCKPKKKSKSCSRRWSFTISDLLFKEFTNREPIIIVNSLGTYSKPSKTSHFTSCNSYEQLQIDQRELTSCYTTLKSASRLKNTKQLSTKNFKFNTL